VTRTDNCLVQLCSTHGPWAACGPVEGFVRPSLGFSCSLQYWQPVLILIILNLTFLMRVVLNAALSRLVLLQLGFERFQYI